MGLSGCGKTTLVRELAPLLNAVVFNNDEVRKNVNLDLGFSESDRIEQARRMGWMCDQVAKTGQFAIADFICPTRATRRAFGSCFMVYIKTDRDTRHEDTKRIFEPPESYDFIIDETNFNPFEMAKAIRDAVVDTRPASLFIGRFQPLHEGHIKLISAALKEDKRVVVGLRDRLLSDTDPFTIEERKRMFARAFGSRVEVMVMPDIEEVCYGRKVGYGLREIKLDGEIEAISGTQVRAEIGAS